VLLFGGDRWGLSCLFSERYDVVAREVRGYCLDVGCGPHNRFVNRYLNGCGRGVDVFLYDGLTTDHLLRDATRFPFADASFETATFNANFNHIPPALRDPEIAEAYRVLKPGGNVVVTMGNPAAEIVVHQLLWLYDRVLGTRFDLDNIRGRQPGETHYVGDREIIACLRQQRFTGLKKKYFWTQWGLNHLFVAWKRADASGRDPDGDDAASVDPPIRDDEAARKEPRR
jgi:SAM-dependent methyltransferase